MIITSGSRITSSLDDLDVDVLELGLDEVHVVLGIREVVSLRLERGGKEGGEGGG